MSVTPTSAKKPSPPGPLSRWKRTGRASDRVRATPPLALLLALSLLGLLVLAGCSDPGPPVIGTPGQVSLVFFYTEA